jgi:hypothetical protein
MPEDGYMKIDPKEFGLDPLKYFDASTDVARYRGGKLRGYAKMCKVVVSTPPRAPAYSTARHTTTPHSTHPIPSSPARLTSSSLALP